jgi:hypothetical protein
MSPLENAELEARRLQLVEEFLALVGGETLMPSGLTALNALLEIQAAAGLLSNMGPDEDLSFDEQVEQVRARFARIELAALAEEDDEDGVEDGEDGLEDNEEAPSPAAAAALY